MSRGRKPPAYITWLGSMRREFQDVRLAYLQLAEMATNGKTLNVLGRVHGVDTQDMLTRNSAYIRKYASRELLYFIAEHPRLTFDSYLEQIMETES